MLKPSEHVLPMAFVSAIQWKQRTLPRPPSVHTVEAMHSIKKNHIDSNGTLVIITAQPARVLGACIVKNTVRHLSQAAPPDKSSGWNAAAATHAWIKHPTASERFVETCIYIQHARTGPVNQIL